MSKLKITLETEDDKVVLILQDRPDLCIDKAIDLLTDEPDDTLNLIKSVDGRIAVDTPDSSWVESIEFAPLGGELIFVAADGARIPLAGNMETFKKALKADSKGKFFWELKRGRV